MGAPRRRGCVNHLLTRIARKSWKMPDFVSLLKSLNVLRERGKSQSNFVGKGARSQSLIELFWYVPFHSHDDATSQAFGFKAGAYSRLISELVYSRPVLNAHSIKWCSGRHTANQKEAVQICHRDITARRLCGQICSALLSIREQGGLAGPVRGSHVR